MGLSDRWMPAIVTAGVAALLAAAAVVTADQAGCDEPGRYVSAPGGVQLVGGCLNSADLPVAPPPVQTPSSPVKPLGD
ncbi:MAG TPA: hypothetical protein VGO16_07475 [Pseudonocardiaceae bacterium]|jgi:hypothetical protein|nr:hypothetical protein [Pseudonocardiaceae bacterium]